MERVMDSVRRSHAPLCSVCDGRGAQAPIILCADCADPTRVRTFCASCKVRLDLSLEDARELLEKFGIAITHSGITFSFPDGCPSCRGQECGAPKIYALDDVQHPHGRVA